MQNKPLAPTVVQDLIEQFISNVEQARAFHNEPTFCIVSLDVDGAICGWVGCLFAANVIPTKDNRIIMPTSPIFYPQDVCQVLTERGIVVIDSMSKRTGVEAHWCSISDTFI
jgi:hypothetical protein